MSHSLLELLKGTNHKPHVDAEVHEQEHQRQATAVSVGYVESTR